MIDILNGISRLNPANNARSHEIYTIAPFGELFSLGDRATWLDPSQPLLRRYGTVQADCSRDIADEVDVPVREDHGELVIVSSRNLSRMVPYIPYYRRSK